VKTTKRTINKIKKLRAGGASFAEIHRKLGVSRETAKKYSGDVPVEPVAPVDHAQEEAPVVIAKEDILAGQVPPADHPPEKEFDLEVEQELEEILGAVPAKDDEPKFTFDADFGKQKRLTPELNVRVDYDVMEEESWSRAKKVLGIVVAGLASLLVLKYLLGL
jgi:hypothetical protein